MGKIKSYRIIEGAIQIVVQEVNQLIEDGYSPYGPPSVYESMTIISRNDEGETRRTGVTYSQAMVKEEDVK